MIKRLRLNNIYGKYRKIVPTAGITMNIEGKISQ